LQNRGSLHAQIILWVWLQYYYDNTWWTGDELSALVMGNIISTDGNEEKIAHREALIAEILNDTDKSIDIDNIADEDADADEVFKPINELEDGNKARVRAARQLLADIAEQYVNATMPCKADGFSPTDPIPNTKMLKPDSIDHASLRTFNYNEICSKFDGADTADIEFEEISEKMDQELYDIYTSVQLHLEEHTFTCFKKGCYCR